MNKGEIEAEFQKQIKKVQDAKEDTLKQEDLKVQMEDFLKVWIHFSGELCVSLNGDSLF